MIIIILTSIMIKTNWIHISMGLKIKFCDLIYTQQVWTKWIKFNPNTHKTQLKIFGSNGIRQ